MATAKLNHMQVETRLSDIFSHAVICKQTSSEWNGMVREFLAMLNERTPGGTRRYSQEFVGYARGFARCLDRRIMEGPDALVEFVYRDAEGVCYSTHKTSTHRSTEEFYETGRGCELGDMECAHVWKGTSKPFTPWTIPNVESAKHKARESAKSDPRYTVSLEGTGKATLCYVVRFCGEWAGQRDTEIKAWDLAAAHHAERQALLKGE